MSSSHRAYEIAPDDEDLELQDDLVATSRNGLLPTHTTPASANAKGKGRETPAGPTLEGRIGGTSAGGAGGGSSQRQTAFGGIQTETRSAANAATIFRATSSRVS